MGIECQILLVAPKEGIYKSGHPVVGTLKFMLDKQTLFESVVLRFEGKGKCSWSESDDDSTTWYTGEETYMSITKNIMLAPRTYLEAGVHVHPFEYFIPESYIPSSFNDPICTIAYKVIAEFKKPALFGSKVFDAEIPVYGYVVPCSPEPLIFGLTKNPFSLTSNNAIDLRVEIEKTFLTPGENIKLKCSINNRSNVLMTAIKTKLIDDIKYISDNNYKRTIRRTIRETIVEHPGTQQNSLVEFSYIVPTLANLYSIQHTKILIREYKLNVTVKLPFPHRNASVEIPVVIGEPKPTHGKEKDCAQEDYPEKKRPLGFVV